MGETLETLAAAAQAELRGDPNKIVERVATLQDADPATVSTAMKEVTEPSEIRILVVGDAKSVVPQLKEAGFVKVELLDSDGRKVR